MKKNVSRLVLVAMALVTFSTTGCLSFRTGGSDEKSWCDDKGRHERHRNWEWSNPLMPFSGGYGPMGYEVPSGPPCYSYSAGGGGYSGSYSYGNGGAGPYNYYAPGAGYGGPGGNPGGQTGYQVQQALSNGAGGPYCH